MKCLVNFLYLIALLYLLPACSAAVERPIPGAERISLYKPLLKGKSVAVVANQTSMVGKVHLVDKLRSEGIRITTIFAPEHGFREMADAGQKIMNGKDAATGIPIISLYGDHLKPTAEDLKGIDIVIYDIQDVGARFYTYISTLHYLLEACGENNIRCLVLDRPNPNGFYYDGNIADTNRRSFVGIDPVPVVHGLTIGEYAGMANGEGWLKNGVKCDLTVIKCENYTHETPYDPPVCPSPNLPNLTSVYLYPSLCFFEGTNISVGRGTAFPFQVYGSPLLPDRGFTFTPERSPGARSPFLEGVKCFGTDLRDAIGNKLVPVPHINLEWLIKAYRDYPEKDKFFNSYFDVLASGTTLREQIEKGMSADEIRATWKEGLDKYGKAREKYLLYK
jgi:uncharacterized protein YbbC (DUF1343 family)